MPAAPGLCMPLFSAYHHASASGVGGTLTVAHGNDHDRFTRRTLLLAAASLPLAAPAIAQAQPLRTAVDGTFAPHAFPNLQGGGVQGFNVDLFREVARRLGRPLELTSTQFSGILPALNAGQYDFVAGPRSTVTRERAENLLFTEGYLDTDFRLVTRRADAPITDLAALRGGRSRSTAARSTRSGRGRWSRASAGPSRPSARRPTRCRPSSPTAWSPTSRPRRSRLSRCATRRRSSSTISTRPASSGPRPCASATPRCATSSRTRSSASSPTCTMARIFQTWFGIAPRPDSAAVTVFPGTGVPGMPNYVAAARTARCA